MNWFEHHYCCDIRLENGSANQFEDGYLVVLEGYWPSWMC